jgi:hypothetical protein
MKIALQFDDKLSTLEKIIAKIRMVLQQLYSKDRSLMAHDTIEIDLDGVSESFAKSLAPATLCEGREPSQGESSLHNTSEASDSDYVPDEESEESETESSEESDEYSQLSQENSDDE